jgi:hypothetical protein
MPLMTRRLSPIFLLLLAGCSAATEPVGLSSEFQYSFSDPVGDTLPPPPNIFQRALDARAIQVGLTADSIIIRVEFTDAISPWSHQTLNSIDGFIDLDIDDNPATGYPAATQEFAGVDARMGVEAYISLRDDGMGHLMRRDGQATDWRSIPVEFADNSFTLRLARNDVGEDDGVFRVSAMIGGAGRWITDLVPGNGHYRVDARQ